MKLFHELFAVPLGFKVYSFGQDFFIHTLEPTRRRVSLVVAGLEKKGGIYVHEDVEIFRM